MIHSSAFLEQTGVWVARFIHPNQDKRFPAEKEFKFYVTWRNLPKYPIHTGLGNLIHPNQDKTVPSEKEFKLYVTRKEETSYAKIPNTGLGSLQSYSSPMKRNLEIALHVKKKLAMPKYSIQVLAILFTPPKTRGFPQKREFRFNVTWKEETSYTRIPNKGLGKTCKKPFMWIVHRLSQLATFATKMP